MWCPVSTRKRRCRILFAICWHGCRLCRKGNEISRASYIVFVDDGSTDGTWTLIAQTCAAHPKQIRGLKLAHNAGHQNALLAGLLSQIGKAQPTISLDADLQDDLSVVTEMLDQFCNQDVDIVFGVRKDRKSDTVFKRASAGLYCRLVDSLGAKVIPHHADFRLMSDRAVRALASYGEVNLFLRGLVVQLGFKTGIVEFDRLPPRARRN